MLRVFRRAFGSPKAHAPAGTPVAAAVGNLVVTADIPLAAEVIKRGGSALDPRGDLYSEDNVSERLAVRNLMQELRSTGDLLGGPAPFGPHDRPLFANHLDHFLMRHRHP